MDFTSINIPLVLDNCKDDDGENSDHCNKENEVPAPPAAQNNEKIENNERSNGYNLKDETTKKALVIGSEEWQDALRNYLFFLRFVVRTGVMVVALVLTVLAVEWPPVQQLVERNPLTMCVSFLILAGAQFLFVPKFVQNLKVRLVINSLYVTSLHWVFIVFTNQFSIISEYCAILSAFTTTAIYLFLAVLIYLRVTNFKELSTYIFAGFVLLLILCISQIYFSFWCSKGFFMSYGDYMINVGLGIGDATFTTFEVIELSRRSVKKLRFKKDKNGKTVLVTEESAVVVGSNLQDNGLNDESQPVNV